MAAFNQFKPKFDCLLSTLQGMKKTIKSMEKSIKQLSDDMRKNHARELALKPPKPAEHPLQKKGKYLRNPRSYDRSKLKEKLPDFPPKRCFIKGCNKLSKNICKVGGEYACKDHGDRFVRCRIDKGSVYQCRRDESSVTIKRCNPKAGRCVVCTGGKDRKQSRTRCQICVNFICNPHQKNCFRCKGHAKNATLPRCAGSY